MCFLNFTWSQVGGTRDEAFAGQPASLSGRQGYPGHVLDLQAGSPTGLPAPVDGARKNSEKTVGKKSVASGPLVAIRRVGFLKPNVVCRIDM